MQGQGKKQVQGKVQEQGQGKGQEGEREGESGPPMASSLFISGRSKETKTLSENQRDDFTMVQLVTRPSLEQEKK